LGVGGAALLGTSTSVRSARRALAQDGEGEGEAVPLPAGAVQLVMPFEFAVRQGPSAGLTGSGTLSLVIEPSGAVGRGVMTNDDGGFVAAVVGQITGRAVNLAFTLEDGRVLYGVGTSRGDLRMGVFELGGPLVGPEQADAGDWLALGQSAQDSSGAIYLVDAIKHAVYRVDNVSQPQVLYAGVVNTPGLVNGQRLSARFNSPIGIGIRGSDNAVLLADTNNRAIRLVNRSNNQVSTMLTAAQATAMVPGLSFVVHGVGATATRVFIADRNSHVILRYNPTNGQLQVLAGAVNQAGMRDGTGTAARFRNPTGVSVSPDGSIVNVVDAGNGLIRQITMNGQTSTIGSVSN
jgi:hypothetical protein